MDPFADIIDVNRALLAFHDLSLANSKQRGFWPVALANMQQ
ncbi:MAG: hypothetical protein OXG53_02295 [Chloroflexi bacterium]|nr:hypothetical protein [Chloroflexota bacterium]